MSAAVVKTIDLEDLRHVIADVLEVEAHEVGDEVGFVEDLGADSLTALEVVVVMERRYGVKLKESELREISCLRKAYDLLRAKLEDEG
jgi:acyl carrier protein